MNAVILRGLPCELRHLVSGRIRHFATTKRYEDDSSPSKGGRLDVAELLSKPSWSVTTLMPSSGTTLGTPNITPKQLHHLLRLSALPPPQNADEERRMLETLSSQLHFVKEIQKVDTAGVNPLRSLRDETRTGEQEMELGVEALKGALAKEELRGKHYKRIRRQRQHDAEGGEWNVLGTANKKVGRFFVVEGGKDG